MAETLVWGAQQSAGGPPDGLHPEPRMGVAANLDGHLEVFAYSFTGEICHTWQTGGPVFTAQSKWSPWSSLGRPPAQGTTYQTNTPTPIRVIQGSNYRLDVFVLGLDRAIWHISQTTPNGGWGGWQSLGAPEAVGPGTGYQFTVAINPAHATEVVLCDQNGNVFTKAQTSWSGEPVWASTWTALGHPNLPAPVFKSIAVESYGISAQYPKGALEIVGLGTGPTNLWHNVQAGESENSWSGWQALPQAAPTPVPSLVAIDAIAANTGGRLELIGKAANGDLWHTWQNAAAPGSWSSDWDNFGQPEWPLNAQCSFDALMDRDGAFHVAGFSEKDVPVERIYRNNAWSGWQPLRSFIGNGPKFAQYSPVILKQNHDKLLSLFCISGDGKAVFFMPQEVSTV
jgi:hypothetical protein